MARCEHNSHYMLFAAALCCALTSPAAAQDRVSLLFGSKHLGSAHDRYVEKNLGVFVTWDQVTVGIFENSYGNPSPYVGMDWDIGAFSDISFEAFAGGSYYPRYNRQQEWTGGRILPVVGVRAIYGNVFAQISAGDMDNFYAVAAVGLTFDLD